MYSVDELNWDYPVDCSYELQPSLQQRPQRPVISAFGGNYAMLQMLMILSVLLRKYDFRLVPGQTIEARPW